jgi:hypothetical protein
MKQLLALLMIALLSISFVACSNDDDNNNGTGPVNETPAWVGTWLSADANVAPILVTVFNYDSVRVVMNEDNTISLSSHIRDGAWSAPISGVYTVTEESNGNVHSIAINYTAFEQEGIIQVTAGNPDQMQLEAVQTVPDIGAVPRTPATGFGSDATLGTLNIQKYIREN